MLNQFISTEFRLSKTEIVFKSLYLLNLDNAPEVYDRVFSVPLSILASEVLNGASNLEN